MNKIYEYVESLCKKEDITITELCRRTGISRSTLSDLKRGRIYTLSAKTMRLIADYFGVSADEMLNLGTFGVAHFEQASYKHVDYLFNDLSRLAAKYGADTSIVEKASEIESQKQKVADILRTFCRVDRFKPGDEEAASQDLETLSKFASLAEAYFSFTAEGREKLLERTTELKILNEKR